MTAPAVTPAPRPWQADPRIQDAALAGGLFAAAVADSASGSFVRGPLALIVLALAALTAPLLWRRRAPLAMSAVMIGAALVQAAFLTSPQISIVLIFLLFVPTYSVGAYAPAGRAAIGLAMWAAGVVAVNLLDAKVNVGLDGDTATTIVSNEIFLVPPWLAGRVMRGRRKLISELRAQAAALAAERDRQARIAAARERARVARELQVIVAAGIETMVVQAGAARRTLDAAPAEAGEAIAAIERTGREALGEMRRLLGVLRTGAPGAERTPQPTLERAPALAARMRARGMRISLTIEGRRPDRVSPAVDLNTLRGIEDTLEIIAAHLPDADVRVTIRYLDGAVEVEVADRAGDGLAELQDLVAESGSLPLQERVALYDGTIGAGPVPGGGFAVRATLPTAERVEVA